MEFITFTLTVNGKAVILRTNDLVNLPEIDYKQVIIQLSNITHIVLEERSEDGINVTLTNGTKYSVSPGVVTMVGNNDYKLLPSYVCPDNETLLTDLMTLIGW